MTPSAAVGFPLHGSIEATVLVFSVALVSALTHGSGIAPASVRDVRKVQWLVLEEREAVHREWCGKAATHQLEAEAAFGLPRGSGALPSVEVDWRRLVR